MVFAEGARMQPPVLGRGGAWQNLTASLTAKDELCWSCGGLSAVNLV